jgi:hypothetical protein
LGGREVARRMVEILENDRFKGAGEWLVGEGPVGSWVNKCWVKGCHSGSNGRSRQHLVPMFQVIEGGVRGRCRVGSGGGIPSGTRQPKGS